MMMQYTKFLMGYILSLKTKTKNTWIGRPPIYQTAFTIFWLVFRTLLRVYLSYRIIKCNPEKLKALTLRCLHVVYCRIYQRGIHF